MAVKGLIGNAKRVLLSTKNEEKIHSIKDGVKVLEQFLEDFDRENRAILNMAYLPIDIVDAFDKPKVKSSIEFVEAYNKKANGQYELLRTLYPIDDDSKSWDIIRNAKLEKIKRKIRENKIKLFEDDDSPTEEHLEMIHWAYSPNAEKLKTYVATRKVESCSQKRKSCNQTTCVEKKARS